MEIWQWKSLMFPLFVPMSHVGRLRNAEHDTWASSRKEDNILV